MLEKLKCIELRRSDIKRIIKAKTLEVESHSDGFAKKPPWTYILFKKQKVQVF
jgi:hypothetical protein